MWCAAFAPILLLFPAGDPPKKSAAAAAELQRFQGTWEIEAWEEDGRPLAAADAKRRNAFFGDNVFILRREDKVIQAGAVQLDPGKSPRTVNLSVKEGEGKDGVMLGIYAFEGDTLTLCFDPEGQSRPKAFKADAKSGFKLLKLKKPKPPADEAVEIVGKYRSELTEPTGKQVEMMAVVEKRGEGYMITYKLGDKVLFIGTGLRRGNQLSVGWLSAGQVGVSVYKIESGPKLVGEYTILGSIGLTGKETLTPLKPNE